MTTRYCIETYGRFSLSRHHEESYSYHDDPAEVRTAAESKSEVDGCIYKGERFGWVFYYSQINDPAVLYRIDNTVRKRFNRFKIAVPPNPKRAVKAYFEAKRTDKTSHKYIPNYDSLTVPAVRTFLTEIGVSVSGLPDDEVLIAFNRVIGRATHRLQKELVRHVVEPVRVCTRPRKPRSIEAICTG